jgi:hypothetical protein
MTRPKTLRAFGAALLAVSLAGCMKMDMQLELSSDDTVDGSIIFALSRETADMAESMGQDIDSMFEEMGTTDLPENAEAEPYEDDDYVGQRYTFEDAALSEFSEEDGFGITHEGDEFVVTGEMDMTDAGAGGEGLGGELGTEMPDLEGMMDSFDISLSITFPGEVVEHNGELDGNTVTWVPTPGEVLEINARAKDSSDGPPVWLWVVIAAVVLAALVGLLFFLSRNRTKRQQEASSEAAAGAVSGAAVPPPPADADTPSSERASDTSSAAAPPPPAPPASDTAETRVDTAVDEAAGEPEAPTQPAPTPESAEDTSADDVATRDIPTEDGTYKDVPPRP